MINGKTKVLGVIGDPIEHTFSPAMHNAGLKELGLNYNYLPFHVLPNNLEKAIIGAKSLDFTGLNVTIPHKIAILDYLDEIDPIANMIGAVNTVKFTNRTNDNDYDNNGEKIAIGYNTDGYGCVRAIKELTDLKDKNVVITGAGGASRAIAFQIANSDINNLSILNRNHQKAANLAKDLNNNLEDVNINSHELDNLKKELENADILIDTTPLGMYPNVNDRPIATADMMHEDLIVNDIVYTPKETTLLKEAKKAGCRTVEGYKMLLYQGVRSFEIWLDRDAPIDVMEKALLDVLGI
ncbi:MAG: shikimate dehydrogenase [Methanobacteriaceae archaeon]|nr:shikimate dehydrogenase [Methanobacteriaceae archaeon]